MILRASLLALAGCLAGSSVAIAQTPPAPATSQAAPAKPAKDPNEMICERQQELGSRLATAKVCHTRAEWADLRHQDREMVDQAQTRLGMPGK